MPFGPILLINIFVGEVMLIVNLKANHLIEKLLGRLEFKGVSPVDAFCGFIETQM